MIKYFVNEEKRQVIGLLEDTRWDAINKINKMMLDTGFCVCMGEKYIMPSDFRAVVTCDPADEFDVEVGKQIAKKRILERYYTALDKRIDKFREALLMLNGQIFDTPDEMKNNS